MDTLLGVYVYCVQVYWAACSIGYMDDPRPDSPSSLSARTLRRHETRRFVPETCNRVQGGSWLQRLQRGGVNLP